MAGITLYSIMDILSHKLYLGGVYPSGPFIVGAIWGTFVLFFYWWIYQTEWEGIIPGGGE